MKPLIIPEVFILQLTVVCMGLFLAGNSYSASAQATIYKGTSSYSSDVIYTVEEGNVYRGTSSYTSDIVFTIRDSKIYKGTSTYTSDILAHIENNKVYNEDSNYSSDILFTIKGDLTITEFVAVWWVVNYVY